MKRRNADCGKLRRPMKRNKITEGMYGSTTVLYMKFLILWAIVITADFMFMFRFEFLWPFWLLLRSVHDSFKYKGLAFSVLFVCIAITSDLVCLFFIPVHWLLFAASTYVWVQYVWHTDKGICLPTIILWMLFVYLEAFIRWKDSRHTPHLDLCRPFAAHCIGYPVVTLGFGFKSYVGYRMRQRKQREVSKENEFYMQLLQQALPQEEPTDEAQLNAVTTSTAVSTTQQQNNSTITSSISTTATSLSSTAASIVNAVSSSFASNATLTGAAATNGIVSAFASIANHAQNHLQQNNNSPQQQNDHQIHHNSSASTSSSSSSNNTSSSHHNDSNSNSNSNSKTANHLQSHTNHVNHASSSTSSSNNNNNNNNNSNNNNTTTNSGNSNSGSSSNSTSSITATANGHIGGNTKNQRRSMDKEHKNKGNTSGGGGGGNVSSKDDHDNQNQNQKQQQNKSNNNNNNSNYHQVQQNDSSSSSNNNNNSKDKSSDWDGSNHQVHHPQSSSSTSPKDKDNRSNNTNSSKKVNNSSSNHSNSSGAAATSTSSNSSSSNMNGSVLQFETDDVVAVEPVVEKPKGRRNRSKRDNASKDNHNHLQQNSNNNSSNSNNNNNNNNNNNSSQSNNNHSNNVHNHHHNTHHNHHQKQQQNHSADSLNNNVNSDASSVSSSSSTTSSASASSTISHLASKVVAKICESCLKLEADIKKYRSEISHMKQIENELRQKLEANLTTKSCLQAKQKECDELEKRIQEMSNARHADMLQLQTAERRLVEERRQKQSLEAQLNNEKKARKLAEEKAARPECSSQCKQRKQQMDEELKQLRRDLKTAEEAKQQAEQHGRKCEQEMRIFEQEIRNRDSQQSDTEMLMSALASLKDKNSTLEKNLSAETRVKLDLFSALGDAKRQLEISEGRRRTKEDEVLDLKAKIAQLLAVLPNDSLSFSTCSSTGASSMLRMNDTPPLQTGPGPSSPMLNSLNAQQASHGGHQLNPRNAANDFVQQVSEYCSMATSNGQVSQQQCSGHVPVSVATSVLGGNGPSSMVGSGHSGLDPNASIYKPKVGQNCNQGNMGVGVGVVVGGSGDA